MPGTRDAVDRTCGRPGELPDRQPRRPDLRAHQPGLLHLVRELGRGGPNCQTEWIVRLAGWRCQKVDPQLSEVGDKEPEQPIAVVVGVPTRVGAEEGRQYAPDGPSRHV